MANDKKKRKKSETRHWLNASTFLEDAKHQYFNLKRPALARSANSYYVPTYNTLK